ncbi:hypothetical protein H257_04835 [Aphanomyces astaci]|uniref:Kinesin motor domain-containing protein n=1 Tax=Aphanomyces astaci TaxID=112090 RepID=W4GTU9_APHAT|nr:hypothetical protein H257_04835 [Aphanomyces astaci]ETV83107.1 hypothetical protein H257_04835 [Aphanomyces astaci]|eukprot:XP_009827778.1 hypothetical protein H257_04835 [Aphanomyces astaci]
MSEVPTSDFAMNSKIRVVVRVRPQLASEKTHSCATLQLDNQSVRLGVTERKEFRFDHVLGPSASQKEVYDTTGVAQSIASVLEGYHATLFAYGQTGSGKTYTMEGFEYERIASSRPSERAHTKAKIDVSSDRLGIVPRVILELFAALKTAAVVKNKAYQVKSSFVQIYNEQILDLFNPSSKRCLKLRWAAESEFFVEDLSLVDSATGQEMLVKFTEGVKQKIMASTNMNAASSRSHCIYTIYVESIDLENPALVTTTKLCLVDLAGSERVVKTGATGVTLQEAIGINKSLFVLRQVIQILSDEANNAPNAAKPHVPYRDSKLTSLLKHSLGGNSITVMVVCLSPSDLCYEENLSTLQYAARAQQISNTPVKNAGEAHKVLVQQLRDTIRSLQSQLTEIDYSVGPSRFDLVFLSTWSCNLWQAAVQVVLVVLVVRPHLHPHHWKTTKSNHRYNSKVTELPCKLLHHVSEVHRGGWGAPGVCFERRRPIGYPFHWTTTHTTQCRPSIPWQRGRIQVPWLNLTFVT